VSTQVKFLYTHVAFTQKVRSIKHTGTRWISMTVTDQRSVAFNFWVGLSHKGWCLYLKWVLN